jgi:hypothetical protein
MLSNLDDPGHDGPVLRPEGRWICDGTWALVGFRNLEAAGEDGFEICDPILMQLVDGVLAAR